MKKTLQKILLIALAAMTLCVSAMAYLDVPMGQEGEVTFAVNGSELEMLWPAMADAVSYNVSVGETVDPDRVYSIASSAGECRGSILRDSVPAGHYAVAEVAGLFNLDPGWPGVKAYPISLTVAEKTGSVGKVSVVKDEYGQYQLRITGLAPNTETYITIGTEMSYTYFQKPTNNQGVVDCWMDEEMMNDEELVFSVWQFSGLYADGSEAGFTRTVCCVDAPVPAYGEEEEEENQGDGAITITRTPGMLYGNFTGPEDGRYAPYFYNSEDPSAGFYWMSGMRPGKDVQLHFIRGWVDRFRLYDDSDGNRNFASKEPLYDIPLEKPIAVEQSSFFFPHSSVGYTVTENPEARNEYEKYILEFTNLDFAKYSYMLRTDGGTYHMTNAKTFINEEALGEVLIMAYRTSEYPELYLMENSEYFYFTLSLEGSGEVPEEPEAPTEGYEVTLTAMGGCLWASTAAHEGVTAIRNCSIEFYSSASGKTFGNGGFPIGITAVVVPEAGEEVYDRVRLVNRDTEEVLLDRALEKSVYVGDEMDAPEGVTVSRTEVTDEEGRLVDRYTVTGIDLTKYGYELSGDGYGGKVNNTESFTVGKDYYGDVDTMYIRLLEARENEDSFYFNCSAYATVAVNGGASGGETGEQTVTFELDDEYGLAAKWSAIENGWHYYVQFSRDGGQTWEYSVQNRGLSDLLLYPDMPAGHYNKAMVEAVNDEDEAVGSYTCDIDLVVDEAVLDNSHTSSIVKDAEGYVFEVTGLLEEMFTYYFIETADNSGAWLLCSSEDGSRRFYLEEELATAPEAIYSIWQFDELVGDGSCGHYTRLTVTEGAALPTLGGETPDEPEVPDGEGTVNFVLDHENGILAEWTPVLGAEIYWIYVSQDGTNWEWLAVADGGRISTDILAPDVPAATYTYAKVEAENEAGEPVGDYICEINLIVEERNQSGLHAYMETDADGFIFYAENLIPNTPAYFRWRDVDSNENWFYFVGERGKKGFYFSDKYAMNPDATYSVWQFVDFSAKENTARFVRVVFALDERLETGGGEMKMGAVSIAVPAGAEVHMDGGVYTSADGKMTICNIAPGTYDLQVKKSGFLTYTVKGITVGAEDIDLGTVTLLAGDTNNDGMINIVDMGIFRQNFGKTGENIANAYTDTNGDKMVNILDMSVFRTNFGKTAAKDCTINYIV